MPLKGIDSSGNSKLSIKTRLQIKPKIVQDVKSRLAIRRDFIFVNLEEEFPEMMVTQRTYEANLKALQTRDKMIGTLLDATG